MRNKSTELELFSSKVTLEQFGEYVDKQGNCGYCWIWKGPFKKKWRKPYIPGTKKEPKRWAHRYFYEIANGTIPKDGMLYRICWNDYCVNPEHMKVVMPGEPQPARIKLLEVHKPSQERAWIRGMGWARLGA